MQRRNSLFAGLLLLSAASVQSFANPNDPPAGAPLPQNAILPSNPNATSSVQNVGGLPLFFESNQGQTDSKVRFLARSGEDTLYITPSEAVFTVPSIPMRLSSERTNLRKDHVAHRSAEQMSRTALRMQMVGADPKASALTQQPLAGRINYFIGKDPRKWHTGVPTFGRVGFHAVYPGIDLVYYGNQGRLEYDFVVAPHADPRQINLHFAGTQRVHINASGDLIVGTQGRALTWRKPSVYQQDRVGKHSVDARFRLNTSSDGQKCVAFTLGRYDTARPLTIDPVLVYSTFLGGSASEAKGIAVDSSGSVYVVGDASSDFPTTPGAYKTAQPLGMFVAKINPTGTALIYSTFFGGSRSNTAAAITIDKKGNAYVTGSTDSADFPTTPGAFQPLKGSTNPYYRTGFVTKVDATGAALVYSTYLGGSGVDDAFSIAVDSSNNAYIVGETQGSDFPITLGAYQGPYSSMSAMFVTKLNSAGTALRYSTLLGPNATNGQRATDIAVDAGGNAYVVGYTSSADYPVTPGAFQKVNHIPAGSASTNGFVTKLNATGSDLVYSTYLGGADSAGLTGIALDSGGNAYVIGQSSSSDFPTTPGSFQPNAPLPAGHVQQVGIVSKLDSTGSALVYSTYLGGSMRINVSGDNPTGIAVDSGGNAYVTGVTASKDFPTTPGALQRIIDYAPEFTGFMTKLNATGNALLYSTYLGGKGATPAGAQYRAFKIAVDSSGNAYVTGATSSKDFPTTPGAFQTVNLAAVLKFNAFVTKLSAIPIFPDFNNDGSTDILIQNSNTNAIASWFMQEAHWVGGAYFSLTPPSEYALVGTGDFAGNGATSLVLQSRTTNQIAYWYTSDANLATISGGQFVNTTPPLDWKVIGVGDFNGDGKSDLVFQNRTTRQVAIWFMNGAAYTGGVLMPFTPPAGWNAVGTGDFNADGFPDLVFQNQTTNQIALWFMNGPVYAGGVLMPNVPGTGWKVVGVGDYNGDGTADLLFQNQTTNQAMVWYLNGGLFQSAENLSLNPPSGWKIVGPR